MAELSERQKELKEKLLIESRHKIEKLDEWNDVYQLICDCQKLDLTGFNILCILDNRYNISKK